MADTPNGTTQPRSLLGDLFSPITGNIQQSIQSSLPSKQEAVQVYLQATLAFWIIGGITLFAVGYFLNKGRSR